MEKYSAVIEPNKEKTASEKNTCPSCGKQLSNSNISHCKDCGIKPFEKWINNGWTINWTK